MHSYWQDLGWDVTQLLLHICDRVMALEWRKNSVSTQYIENEWTEFYQILYMYWQNLGCDCYSSFPAHFYQSYGPWFTPEYRFRWIAWEQIVRISPYFNINASILTRCRLGLLAVIFGLFVTELCPLMYFRIVFLLNVFRFSCLIVLKLGLFIAWKSYGLLTILVYKKHLQGIEYCSIA